MPNKSILQRLEQWYKVHCDGTWEHSQGVKITTLDNPGWAVTIRTIPKMSLHVKTFQINEENSPNDWMRCAFNNQEFRGHGDPSKLENILMVFLDRIADVKEC